MPLPPRWISVALLAAAIACALEITHEVADPGTLSFAVFTAWSPVSVVPTRRFWFRLRKVWSAMPFDPEDGPRHHPGLPMRILAAQEAERTRIAGELHDQLGHALVLLKLRLAHASSELDLLDDPAKRGAYHRSLCDMVDLVIEDVRRLSRDLRPVLLDHLGLSAALRSLVDTCVRAHHRATVESSIADVDDALPEDAKLHVYRILQEALTNAVKHADARRIAIDVGRHANEVAFAVTDDGNGFDMVERAIRAADDGRLGLVTMHERARMARGSLTVRSELGRGTAIVLRIPIV